jgi:hypothetical protein
MYLTLIVVVGINSLVQTERLCRGFEPGILTPFQADIQRGMKVRPTSRLQQRSVDIGDHTE